MMNKTINCLILENQSLLTDVFKKALIEVSRLHDSFDIKVNEAKDCISALNIIKNRSLKDKIDFALLNFDLSSNNFSEPVFSDDIAIELREKFPNSIIMAFIHKFNNYRVNNILKAIDPESILVSSDIDFEELTQAIKICLNEPPYYSKKIMLFVRRKVTNDTELDKYDRLILFHLSNGAKNKDLIDLVNLSKSGIERRKGF